MNIHMGLNLHASALQTLAPAWSCRARAHQEPQHSQKSQQSGRQAALSTHLGTAPVLYCVTGSGGY